MKRVIWIFFGILMLAAMFGMLYLAGGIYNAGNDFAVQPYVFQPNNLSADRIGVPLSIDQMGDGAIMDALVQRFVTEYFYVTPDVENIARRTRRGSILSYLAAPNVFREWVDTVAPEIEQMVGSRMLRTVRVAKQIFKPAGSDYWTVAYELKTWDAPNNMALVPVVTRGVLYLKIAFEKQLREQMHGTRFDVRQYLQDGGDPAAIFRFRVDAVAQNHN